jgi:phosphatidylinositol kinase/protein kinase (PI-3  family)
VIEQGYLIHIDFGFILSIAPGGAFSLESAPFKLTAEMMGLHILYFTTLPSPVPLTC